MYQTHSFSVSGDSSYNLIEQTQDLGQPCDRLANPAALAGNIEKFPHNNQGFSRDHPQLPTPQPHFNMDFSQDKTMHDSKSAVPSGGDIQAVFWAKYQEAATKYDNEFLKSHNRDMDIILIFSGLFSAVDTAFILARTQRFDPRHRTNALLAQLVLGGGGVNATTSMSPTGPLGGVWFETLAYASLSLCLLAAFGAILGKQWLAHYRFNRFGHGTLQERCMQRQQRFDALAAWHFETVLQSFPILLQISILCLGLALSANIWTQRPWMSSAVLAMTAIGIILVTQSLSSSPRVLPTVQPRPTHCLSSSEPKTDYYSQSSTKPTTFTY